MLKKSRFSRAGSARNEHVATPILKKIEGVTKLRGQIEPHRIRILCKGGDLGKEEEDLDQDRHQSAAMGENV
jgi:hypothetical protein